MINDSWDIQIEEDFKEGVFDDLVAQAKEEYKNGLTELMTEDEKKELFASMPKAQGFPKKAEGPWLEFVELEDKQDNKRHYK